MAHSFFLDQFITELVRLGKGDQASLRQRYVDAALRAAHRVFGTDTPISATLAPLYGDVRFHQELDVVEQVTDRRRQIAVADACRIEPGKKAGDTFRIPIAYTWENYEQVQNWQREFGDLVPLPIHSGPLWEELTVELNRELLADFPAPEFAANTLGALMRAGGGWTAGISARHGPVTLTVAKAFWDFFRTDPARGWVDYGFVLRVDGADPGKTKYCGPDGEWRLQKGDNDGIAVSVAQLPAARTSREIFVAELEAIAEEVARVGTDGMSGVTAGQRLLAAALEQPGQQSFLRWSEKHFGELLEGREWVLTHSPTGTPVRFRIVGAFGPALGLEGFGHGAVRIRYEVPDSGGAIIEVPEGEIDYYNEDVLGLGYATSWSLEHGPATDDEESDLRQLAARFLEWLPLQLQHHLDDRGPELGMNYLYAFAGHFPLVELMEARLRHGRPGPVPVPPLSDRGADRGATLLTLPDAETIQRAVSLFRRQPLIVLEAGGFLLGLGDDTSSRPFGDSWIDLFPPGGEHWSEVLRVDVWNPVTRTVVDGDAFAFRRFVEWLRAGIIAAGLDTTLTFWPDDDGDEDDDEDDDEDGDDDREDDDAGAQDDGRRAVQVLLSEWLRFGIPYHGDRFLVDWRHQWDIVLSDATIAGALGGIYGMSPEKLARLENSDRKVWRRFLCEVIDPRFGYAR